MIRLNIHDAKTHLSRYLKRVEAGETLILCRRNVPIAEVRPVTQPSGRPRPIGLYAGEMHVPDDIMDPLPDEVIDAFYSS